MAQKQTAAAETHFKAALAKAPNHVAALNDYAVLLMQQGRRDAFSHLSSRLRTSRYLLAT